MAFLYELGKNGEPRENPKQISGLAREQRERFTLPDYIFEPERRPTLLRLAAALRARGYEEQEIYALLLKANRERCSPPLDHKGQRDLRRMAAWIAKKPPGASRTYVASEQTLHAIEQARAFSLAYAWRGRFSQTCRDVFCALLTLMERTGKTRVDASCRDLAELTGRSGKTVACALLALSGRHQHPSVPVLLFRHVPDRKANPTHANGFALRQQNTPKLTHTLSKERGRERRVCVEVGDFTTRSEGGGG
jgi:hypothetical protein